MKCPDCGKEIHGPTCAQCGAMSPAEGANYCMACGAPLGGPSEDIAEDDNDFDFENRILCPDGACTGIIVNGKCTECGKELKES